MILPLFICSCVAAGLSCSFTSIKATLPFPVEYINPSVSFISWRKFPAPFGSSSVANPTTLSADNFIFDLLRTFKLLLPSVEMALTPLIIFPFLSLTVSTSNVNPSIVWSPPINSKIAP